MYGFSGGISLEHLGKHEEAIRCFDEAMREDPHYALAWFNKGIVLEKFEKHDEATAYINKAITMDSTLLKYMEYG